LNEDIFVIIPSYNEGKVLAKTLEPLIAAGYSVVVVDDGSKDGTQAILSHLPVHSLRHPLNLGQGAALQTGMDYAVSCGAHFLVHYDADGQHRAEDIGRLIAPLRTGEVDVVLGSRFLRVEDSDRVPPLRRCMLKGAIVVNGLLTGVWLTDAHNGFRAMTAEAARQIVLHENGFAHASELLSEIRRHELRYKEVATHIVYSEYSRAKGQSLWNSLNILFDLLVRKIFKK